ncbi:MAG: DegV family protein [Clostridia bacterium]|nr:DegV family protein [Clostridia bacterium]
MNEFVIYTDSACDIKPELLKEWGVLSQSLSFKFDGNDTVYSNDDMECKEFYDRMRGGDVAKTSAINPETFTTAFEKTLSEGLDILYLGFSSGLSTTYNSARIAAEGLLESYPERKIIVIDTLAASAGEGLLVYLAKEKKAEGADIEAVAEYVRSLIMKLCHWFTVDDLVYLKRGGRVSPAAAFFGNMLGIKPVLHVDNEGHLTPVQKVRGRKTAIETMATKYGELADDKAGGVVFISHADCEKDANALAEMLNSRYGASVKIITDVGTVIGAHAGPGTLALFFVGSER